MKNSVRLRFLGVNGAVNLERMDFDFEIGCEKSWAEFVGDPIIVVLLEIRSCMRPLTRGASDAHTVPRKGQWFWQSLRELVRGVGISRRKASEREDERG